MIILYNYTMDDNKWIPSVIWPPWMKFWTPPKKKTNKKNKKKQNNRPDHNISSSSSETSTLKEDELSTDDYSLLMQDSMVNTPNKTDQGTHCQFQHILLNWPAHLLARVAPWLQTKYSLLWRPCLIKNWLCTVKTCFVRWKQYSQRKCRK